MTRRLPDGPKIGIQTQWVPASDGHAVGTIVAVEGGPGYPSTGSYDEYAGTFAPLLKTHNLVLVDNRGTGGSGILICPRLQRYTGRTSGPRFAKLVGACGDSLNHRFKLPDGRWLHASDLYGTAYAVADLAAILRKLHTGPVTIYGDSYGSWFTQAFIARHPTMVRAVILDSTYYLRGLVALVRVVGDRGAARDAARLRAQHRLQRTRRRRRRHALRADPRPGPPRSRSPGSRGWPAASACTRRSRRGCSPTSCRTRARTR